MKTHKFARKTFYVDAVRVSEANIKEVAEWCNGTIETDETGHTFLQVEVQRPLNDRQTQAYIGDWVLMAGSGFKVYVPKAFDKAFEKAKYFTKEQADEAGIKVPHEPRPKNEKKKPAEKKAAASAEDKAPVPEPPKKKLSARSSRKPPRVGHVGQALKEAEERKKDEAPKTIYKDNPLPADAKDEALGTQNGEGIKPKKSKQDVEADKLVDEVKRLSNR